MSSRLFRRTVRLLAVVWVAALCDADQPLPTSTADQQLPASAADQQLLASTTDQPHGETDGSPGQLLTLVSRAVKTATGPIVAELSGQRALLEHIVRRLVRQDSRLDSLDSRLDSRLDSVRSRLDSLNSGLDSQLDSVRSRLDSLNLGLDSQLDSVRSRLDSLNSGLASRLYLVTSRLDFCHLPAAGSKNSGLDLGQDSASSRPGSIDSQPDSANSSLDVHSRPPRDCSDLPADTPSGIHLIRPGPGHSAPVQAFCDMDTDGGNWTVFQRRADILPRQDFYLGWQAYRDGFGELDAEFWWGLQNTWLMIHRLDRRYELRVDLEDFDGQRRHALYQDFRISPAGDGYRITGGDYTGDAGDSLSIHFGQRFSTKDKDQDTVYFENRNCARMRKGAWWYGECGDSNLNGQYMLGEMKDSDGVVGVYWRAWKVGPRGLKKGLLYSLKTVEMKIRPT